MRDQEMLAWRGRRRGPACTGGAVTFSEGHRREFLAIWLDRIVEKSMYHWGYDKSSRWPTALAIWIVGN